MKTSLLSTVAIAITSAAALHAVEVQPTSYDTPNGYSGSYNYWDESYSGAGNTSLDGDALTGGLGDLTDGVIASDNWNIAEAPGSGPYVGWTIDAVIDFHFGGLKDFTSVTLHLDDSDGYGGVSAPHSIGISLDGGPFAVTVIPEPAGFAPFSVNIPIGPASDVSIQLLRKNAWVFLSEVDFEARTHGVPDAASTLGLLSVALAGLAACRRRR